VDVPILPHRPLPAVDLLKRNVQNAAVGFATMAHSAIFPGVQRGGVSTGYMSALLTLFALVIAVLLFRRKLAANVPWLRMLRRADMKQQEAEILKAAIALEQQLTCAVPLEPPSHHVDTPRHLSSSAHQYVYEQAPLEAVSDQEGQPGAPARDGTSAAAEASEPSLTLRLSEEFQRELAILPLATDGLFIQDGPVVFRKHVRQNWGWGECLASW